MTLQNKSINEIEKLYKLVVCHNDESIFEENSNEIIEETNDETEYKNTMIEEINTLFKYFKYDCNVNDYDSIESFMNKHYAKESQEKHYPEMLKRYNDDVDNDVISFDTLAEENLNFKMDNSPNLSNTNHVNPPKEQISSTRLKIEEFTKKFNYGEKFKIFLINILNYENYRLENCFSVLSKSSINHQKSDISEEYLYLTHKYDIIPTSFNEQYISDQIEHYMNHNEIMPSKFKGFSMTNEKKSIYSYRFNRTTS